MRQIQEEDVRDLIAEGYGTVYFQGAFGSDNGKFIYFFDDGSIVLPETEEDKQILEKRLQDDARAYLDSLGVV